jgi:hypothetical protein
MNDADLIRLIKEKSAAIRSESDLDGIRNSFDADLSTADVVWATLSPRQKNSLCKHFEFRTAFSEDGDLYPCVDKTGAGSWKHNPTGLFVLLHGQATVMSGEYSIVLREGIGERVVAGRLAIPEDAREFFNRRRSTNTYHRFVLLEKKCHNVSIRFHKGSSYLVLDGANSTVFIQRLNASLLTRRILNDIGISGLLSRKKDPIVTDTDDPQVFCFSPGNVLIKGGSVAERILFVAKGSCLIFKQTDRRQGSTVCVGSLSSPSFIGFSSVLLDQNTNDCTFGIHPVSVVAVQGGYAFSFCSRKFLAAISAAGKVDAFRFLAECQKIWNTASEEDDCYCHEKRNDSVSEVGIAEEEDANDPLRNAINTNNSAAKQEDEERNEDGVDSITDLISNIWKGKLKRSKLLTAIHESFTSDDNLFQSSEPNDVDHDLFHSISKQLLREIMANLERDCGVSFGCEDDDPFHNFTIKADEPDREQMSLEMPSQITDRLDKMAGHFLGLGRKRPPEYDNSDPFLLPAPSTVDRRMHGKTLPIVRRSKGSIDPVVYNEKEWL